MRKRKSEWFLILFLTFVSQIQAIYAANEQIVMIDVQQVIKQDQALFESEKTFSYQLQAIEKLSPMPKNSLNGVFNFTMTGNDIVQIDAIHYEQEGIYQYELKQILNDEASYELDEQRYQIIVYVKKTSVGTLDVQVVEQNSKNEKVPVIQFTNKYVEKNGSKNPSADTSDQTNVHWYYISGMSSIMFFIVLFSMRRKKYSDRR